MGRARGSNPVPRSRYGDYLRSDHWKQVRKRTLAKRRRICEFCYDPEHLDVHHNSYARLGKEQPEDLNVLCRRCHSLVHSYHENHHPNVDLSVVTRAVGLMVQEMRKKYPLGFAKGDLKVDLRRWVQQAQTGHTAVETKKKPNPFVPVNQRVDEHERRYAPTGGAEARLDGIPVIKPVPTIERVKVKPAPEDMPTRRRPCQKGWSRKAINKILSNEWFPTSSCWFCGGKKKKKMDLHFYPDGEEKILVCTGCHKGFHTQEDRYPHVSHDELLQAYRSMKRSKGAKTAARR